MPAMAHGQSIYHPFLAIGLKVPYFAVFSVLLGPCFWYDRAHDLASILFNNPSRPHSLRFLIRALYYHGAIRTRKSTRRTRI